MSEDQSWIKGYAPAVTVSTGNSEALKYGQMWERPEYRMYAPGEIFAPMFLRAVAPRPGAHVIDFGCGTGRGAAVLAVHGLKVTMIDFAKNCLDDSVNQLGLEFIKADLEKPIPAKAEYGFCTDVMEHIPPDKVDTVLNNILLAAQSVWFSIALVDDVCGRLIGETLHLSVHPFEWWEEKFKVRNCKILVSRTSDNYAHFFVRAWQEGKDVVDAGKLNTEEEIIIGNVKHNIAQGWQQVTPHETNEMECMILGGGPSLNDFVDEIKHNRADGVKLITMNGAYLWAIDHGLTPSAQIVVDAREFNKRFTKPVLDDCKYLIASQCDPSVFEGLPPERTYIWHTMAEQLHDILNAQYGDNQWWPIPGGSTVLLRAIPLMRMLGFSKFILYGCDSCLTDSRHHAYEQTENVVDYPLPVIVNPGGRIFTCAPFMVSQAHEFVDLIKYLGDEIELDVKGDGLLAHILTVGAGIAEIEESQ